MTPEAASGQEVGGKRRLRMIVGDQGRFGGQLVFLEIVVVLAFGDAILVFSVLAILGDGLDKRAMAMNSRRRCPSGASSDWLDVAALAVHIMSNTALTGATVADIDGGQQLVSPNLSELGMSTDSTGSKTPIEDARKRRQST